MYLTKRDVEILKFILDMKFVCVPQVHQMFFKNKIGGGESKSHWYARERLRELVKCNFLKVVRYRMDGKNYYLGTRKCYEYLNENYADVNVAMPVSDIDIRTFEHDAKVCNARIFLETTSVVHGWKSERFLKKKAFYENGKLARVIAPDGIYTDDSGRQVAFEYEISKKSEGRYREKIEKYVRIMRSGDSKNAIHFSHCRFVCENEGVYGALVALTKIYGGLFSVERSEAFFAPKAPVIQLRPSGGLESFEDMLNQAIRH